MNAIKLFLFDVGLLNHMLATSYREIMPHHVTEYPHKEISL
ncbi:protein of unknown function [Vibrio tapetis subsp. tapetis]|uniref:Uncharacterized protein n=1 Tax=Vibrio tapetis subsp. tapetis TaxID=1671868 RepID=A0A2N8ZEY3_9VIBR|nr:protein of unknown function [Vibrio tapetis subsp. tapetis]